MPLTVKTKKRILFLAGLLPLGLFFGGFFLHGPGPDPGKDLVLFTGQWTIRLLLLTLAVTPMRRILKWHRAIAYRRMIGLYAGFYATLHFLAVMTYFVGWNWSIFQEEFAERPYMAVGIIAWIFLLPLILTSNRWAVRLLGRRWQTLHRLTYVIAVLGCIHVVWLVRSNYGLALLYCLLTALLLGYRLLYRIRSN